MQSKARIEAGKETTRIDDRIRRDGYRTGRGRLAHRLCNRNDFEWRKINAMLGKGMSLEEIAEKLNAKKVPTLHGTNSWTAASVRKASVS